MSHIYFEIQADDIERAMNFYKAIFGWKFHNTHGGKTALPKFAISGVCWHGYFVDSEGNTFGLFEVDENAK